MNIGIYRFLTQRFTDEIRSTESTNDILFRTVIQKPKKLLRTMDGIGGITTGFPIGDLVENHTKPRLPAKKCVMNE